MHDFRFPHEPQQYRQARNRLLTAEIELRRQEEHVAAMRRELPLGGELGSDYTFQEWDDAAGGARDVRLSELFGAHDTLLLYSFMVVAAERREDGAGPRHVDFMWPEWAILDRTPDGRGVDWGPRLDYRP